jgi:hypothetical protein
MKRRIALSLCALCIGGAAMPTHAADFLVGPTREYTRLGALFDEVALHPGDRVLVDAATYGAVVVPEEVVGTAANPIRIIGVRGSGGERPVLQGGVNTIAFFSSHHVVLEGFEIRQGSSRCVFLQADDITIRDSVIHTCPQHGIHGADDLSGSFTLEYSEVFDAGTGSNKHPLYMQSDEHAFPNAVLRIRHNYIHDGNGGNLIKSRFGRTEIHYNWLEGSDFQEIELIGPDFDTQHPLWTDTLVREDSDVVGNVIVHTDTWNTAIRVGGDLNGHSRGRVRLVNNTILFDTPGSGMRAVVVQLGLESLEMHNNVIFQVGDGRAITVYENFDEPDELPPWGTFTPWISGRHVAGSRNWVEDGAPNVPGEWVDTRSGTEPGFVNIALRDLRIAATSALRDTGGNAPTYAAFPMPNALALPLWLPPSRAAVTPVSAAPRIDDGVVDIGAFSFATDDVLLRDGFESL